MNYKIFLISTILFCVLFGCQTKSDKKESKSNDLVEVFHTSDQKGSIKIPEEALKQYQLKTIDVSESRVLFSNMTDLNAITPTKETPLLTIEIVAADMAMTPYQGVENEIIKINKKDIPLVIDYFSDSTTLIARYPFSLTQDLMITMIGSDYDIDQLKQLMQSILENIQIQKNK